MQTAQAAYDCGVTGISVNGTAAVRTGGSWLAHTMTDSFTVAITYPYPRDRRVHVYLHPFLNSSHSLIHLEGSQGKSHALQTHTATFTFGPRPEYVNEQPPFRDQFPFTFNIWYIRNGTASDATKCNHVMSVMLTVHKLELHRPTIIELEPPLPPGLQKVVEEEPLEDKPQEGRPPQPEQGEPEQPQQGDPDESEQGEPEGSGPPPTTTTTQAPPPTTTTQAPPPPENREANPQPQDGVNPQGVPDGDGDPPPSTTQAPPPPPPPTTTTTQPPRSLDDAIACYAEWTCTAQDLRDAHAADRERRRQEAEAERERRRQENADR